MAAKLARSQRTARGEGVSPGRSLLKVGDLLASKYRVERILGEGGMGVVVAAYHELLDQNVAVKLLYQDIADREAQSRLLLEARSAAKLQSEHVARVVDVDVGADGLPFIVMELLEGADLCQIADARGALPRWLVVDYMLQTLEGLAHAHARGIIHRDLKPSNLFLANRSNGTQIIKILDFGISKSQEPPDKKTQQLTGTRTVLGSPPYMSPEQVRSPKTVDHRTDLWSLGICMYELLTNSMPFGGEELQETFAQILEREPTPIRTLVNGVPEGLERVVMKCLAKKREDRFSDVGELAKALAPFGSGTWIQSADRVSATLARREALMEDMTSGTRLKQGPPSSADRIPIPSSPGRRIDSLQPEFHGTAATVAQRFSILEGKKRIVVGACVLFTAVGMGLIAFTQLRKGDTAQPDPSSAETPAPPAAAGAGAAGEGQPQAAPNSVVTPVGTASPENELPGAAQPNGTVLGASTPAPTTSTAKKPAVPPHMPGAFGAVKKPAPPTTTKPALPPGLPQTRSGQ